LETTTAPREETPPIIDIAALGLLALGFALGSGHWALGCS
jgi:hypothetical protein